MCLKHWESKREVMSSVHLSSSPLSACVQFVCLSLSLFRSLSLSLNWVSLSLSYIQDTISLSSGVTEMYERMCISILGSCGIENKPPDPLKNIFVYQRPFLNFQSQWLSPLSPYHVNEINEWVSLSSIICVCVLQVPGEVGGENGESSEEEQQRSDTRRHRHALCSNVCKCHLHSLSRYWKRTHTILHTILMWRHDRTRTVTAFVNALF